MEIPEPISTEIGATQTAERRIGHSFNALKQYTMTHSEKRTTKPQKVPESLASAALIKHRHGTEDAA